MSAPKQNKKQPIATGKPVEHKSQISDEGVARLREETLRWTFCIIGALLVYLVVATIIQSVYHPDIKLLLKSANEISFTGDARPEPMEALLFRAGIVTILLSILGFYAMLSNSKLIKKLSGGSFFLVISVLSVVVIAVVLYLGLAAPNYFAAGGAEQPQNTRDYIGKTNFTFFFDGLFLGDNLLAYTFLLVPLVGCIFYFGIRKYNWDNNKTFQKIVLNASSVFLGLVVLAIVLISTFEFPYTFENKYDFNAVYYSMTQVFAGTPLLTDGFSNTYGMYPQFLNPVFQVIGLSVLKFSLVMSLLIAVVFFLLFYASKKYVNNVVIWFLGCCTMIFIPYLDFRLLTSFDSAFVFFPIRYLIPSSLVFLAALYLRKGSMVVYWTTTVIMGLFVLWNPEIGMVSYLAWVAFNVFKDFYDADGKIAIKKILFHFVSLFGAVLLVFAIYKLGIYAFYGQLPDFEILFSYILHLGSGGFGLLPMVLLHPWNISALIIILGFTYSIVHWYKKNITPKSAIVFLISVISLGFLVYYQGRSHNWPFVTSSCFTLMLLTILGDELWSTIKDKNVLSLHLLFVVFLFIISFSFVEIVYSAPKLNELVHQDDDKEKQLDEQKRILSNEEFIVNHSKEKEKIFIFTGMQYQGLYFDGNKRRTAFNPGFQDMVLRSDQIKLENRIIDSSFSVFIEPMFSSFLFLERPLAALAATYETDAVNLTMALLHKRKTRIPGKTFFAKSDAIVIHRKYTDDTAGIKERINDARGVKPVTLNPEFSVEALFFPKQQIYGYANVVGNMNDTSGFTISNVVNTPKYFFGINGKGVSVALAENEWVYCVMNVFPDHCEIYQDGALVGTIPLPAPMRQCNAPVQVGNLTFMRYFVGAIAEVAVLNKPLSKTDIAATWDEIKK